MGMFSGRRKRLEPNGAPTITLADIERRREELYYGPNGYFAKLAAAGAPEKPAMKGVAPMLKKDVLVEIITEKRPPRFQVRDVCGVLKIHYHCVCGSVTTSAGPIEHCATCGHRP